MATRSALMDALKNAVVESALGQSVAVVLPGRTSAREALDQMLDLSLDLTISKGSRQHGDYRIEFEGGGKLRVFANVDACRGWNADVVYAHKTLTDDQMSVVTPMIATTAGQVLRFQ